MLKDHLQLTRFNITSLKSAYVLVESLAPVIHPVFKRVKCTSVFFCSCTSLRMCNDAVCRVSHSSPLEHAWARVHAQSTSCSWIRGHRRHPVSKQITWTHSCPWRLNPKGPSASPAALHHLKSDEVSDQIALLSFRRRASASGWSLCLVWHVWRNTWPLSSALTATLVTTGTERLSCHSFVSSRSRITSHLSQDYSSDLLPLKQMNVIRTNAAERSYSLLMFLIC